MIIVPTVLEKTPETTVFQIKRLAGLNNNLCIDIADGIFVPNKTASLEEITDLLPGCIPQSLQTDFHLMVEDPRSDIKLLTKLSKKILIRNVFVHDRQYKLFAGKRFPFPIGIALNPPVLIDTIAQNYNLKSIPSFKIMSINPGFQGTSFIPEMLQKIEQLRLKNYRLPIYLDGGVNETTLPVIMNRTYTPDYLIVGSYLTRATRPSDALEKMGSLIKK